MPQGHETSFFAMLNLVERTGAIMSPLSVGLLIDLTGNIRYGFLVSLLLITLSIPLLGLTDLGRGFREAKIWLDERKVTADSDYVA
jgi:UMF1 family MFS transporter